MIVRAFVTSVPGLIRVGVVLLGIVVLATSVRAAGASQCRTSSGCQQKDAKQGNCDCSTNC